jgi:hypothetical protein
VVMTAKQIWSREDRRATRLAAQGSAKMVITCVSPPDGDAWEVGGDRRSPDDRGNRVYSRTMPSESMETSSVL